MTHRLCVLVLLASCYRQKPDPQLVQRLDRIEQRLDAEDKAIADVRARSETSPAELAVLSQQLADLQQKLDTILEQVKKPPARPARREPDADKTYSVPIGKSPAFGSPKAKVTLVMAMDFDCPYCRRAWDTVDELRKRYGKDLRVVYKPYVVHPKTAKLPAQAVCAAQKQNRWRELADLIWTKAFDARATDSDAYAPEHIRALAKQAKLDMKRYDADVAGVCVDEVKTEMASMTKLGVGATPTFFINGRYMAGAQPIENFAKLIDEEMVKADAAIKGGVKAEDYYDHVVVGKGLTEIAAP